MEPTFLLREVFLCANFPVGNLWEKKNTSPRSWKGKVRWVAGLESLLARDAPARSHTPPPAERAAVAECARIGVGGSNRSVRARQRARLGARVDPALTVDSRLFERRRRKQPPPDPLAISPRHRFSSLRRLPRAGTRKWRVLHDDC